MGNKGMMTVEASVVVPIILIIVVAEFFFGLFLIDMSVVKSETMRLADEAADVWKTDGKLADGTYKSQQLLLRNKNFLQKNRRAFCRGCSFLGSGGLFFCGGGLLFFRCSFYCGGYLFFQSWWSSLFCSRLFFYGICFFPCHNKPSFHIFMN